MAAEVPGTQTLKQMGLGIVKVVPGTWEVAEPSLLVVGKRLS